MTYPAIFTILLAMKTFTIEEIKEWIAGYTLTNPLASDCPGWEQHNGILQFLIHELESYEDGIEAVTERYAQYRKEGKM